MLPWAAFADQPGAFRHLDRERLNAELFLAGEELDPADLIGLFQHPVVIHRMPLDRLRQQVGAESRLAVDHAHPSGGGKRAETGFHAGEDLDGAFGHVRIGVAATAKQAGRAEQSSETLQVIRAADLQAQGGVTSGGKRRAGWDRCHAVWWWLVASYRSGCKSAPSDGVMQLLHNRPLPVNLY